MQRSAHLSDKPSFNFARDEIANGAKFFRRAIFEGALAAPPDDAK
jgi:hypothetical protein